MLTFCGNTFGFAVACARRLPLYPHGSAVGGPHVWSGANRQTNLAKAQARRGALKRCQPVWRQLQIYNFVLGLAQVAESVGQRDRFLGRVLLWTVITMATAIPGKCRCHRETTPHHRFSWKLPYRPLSLALKGERQERQV